MNEKEKPSKKRRFSILLMALVIILIIYFVVTLISTHSKINTVEQENESLSQQISEKQSENDSLESTINSSNKDDYIERIARDKYDYAGENERVYYASDAS